MSHDTHTPPRPKAQFTLMAIFWAGCAMPDHATIEQQRALGASGCMNATLRGWQRSMVSMDFLAPVAGTGGWHGGIDPSAYRAAEIYLAGNLRKQFGADKIRDLEFSVFEPSQTFQNTLPT